VETVKKKKNERKTKVDSKALERSISKKKALKKATSEEGPTMNNGYHKPEDHSRNLCHL
jgi:hypothetical protein